MTLAARDDEVGRACRTTKSGREVETCAYTSCPKACRVSINDEETATPLEDLKAAGCERIYREKASGDRWDRPELHPASESAPQK